MNLIDSDDDDDDGEIGEERREEADEDQGDVGRMPRPGPYQHEPEPQQPAAAGQQGEAGAEFGDGVGFRGNRDVSRLDPRNTDDWRVFETKIYVLDYIKIGYYHCLLKI